MGSSDRSSASRSSDRIAAFMYRQPNKSHGNKQRGCCQVDQCRKTVHRQTIGGVRVSSKYCSDHTCRVRGQDARGDEHFCRKRKEPSNEYCSDHRRCGYQGCPDEGENPGLSLPWFCTHHQCVADQCVKPRFATTRFCQEHLPPCTFQGCRNLTTGRSAYCPDHSCTIVDCSRSARDGNRCTAHRPCTVAGCQLYTGSYARPFCQHHTCSRPDCLREAGSAGGVCAEHAPCAADDCNWPRAPGTAFCRRHRCCVSGCAAGRGGGSQFCDRHTCAAGGCVQPLADLDRDDDAAEFCQLHECGFPGCVGRARSSSSSVEGFCDLHAYAVPDAPPGQYGYAHRQPCAVEGCKGWSHDDAFAEGLCLLHLQYRAEQQAVSDDERGYDEFPRRQTRRPERWHAQAPLGQPDMGWDERDAAVPRRERADNNRRDEEEPSGGSWRNFWRFL